jgi:hypothetical protein
VIMWLLVDTAWHMMVYDFGARSPLCVLMFKFYRFGYLKSYHLVSACVSSSSRSTSFRLCADVRVVFRWTGKTASKDHSGKAIHFLTVGGRTTAYVPSLQRKAAVRASAVTHAAESLSPDGEDEMTGLVGDSLSVEDADDSQGAAEVGVSQAEGHAQGEKKARSQGKRKKSSGLNDMVPSRGQDAACIGSISQDGTATKAMKTRRVETVSGVASVVTVVSQVDSTMRLTRGRARGLKRATNT